MNKTKFISVIAIGLLISNLLLVSFILLRHKPEERRQPKEIIIEKLRLDDKQVTAYEQLIHWHRSHIDALDDSIRLLKHQLYTTLNSGINPSPKDSLIGQIGALQLRIEHIHYQHFADIQKLCRPEQLPYYEELTQEIGALFMPHPPKR